MTTRRKTGRKELINEFLAKHTLTGHALLDELRWGVMRKEKNVRNLTRSHVNSFARTVRETMTELHRHKVEIRYIRAGLITRAALFRISEWNKIEHFLNSDKASATCTFSIHNEEYDYWPNHSNFIPSPTKFRLSIGVDLKVDYRAISERIIFPIPTPLTIVGEPRLTDSVLDTLAKVDWKIFLQSVNNKHMGGRKTREISSTESIDINAAE